MPAFIRFLAARTAAAAIVVFVAASATFLLSLAAQGDYVTTALGFGAHRTTVDRQRAARGLDRPAAAVYFDWVRSVARLDFGESLHYQRPVGPLVLERSANTAVLALSALALAALAGIPSGIRTGSRGGVVSAMIRGASAVCLSVPPLIAAILLVAFAAATHVLPVGGMTTLGEHSSGWLDWLRDVAWHLPLPAIALALPFAAILERVQSQAIAEALAEPSVTAALARGLSRRRVLWRHAWRLGARPVAAVAGLIAGTLLSGSFAVELVTSWPGLGRLTYDALVARDFFLAAGCAAAAAVFLAAGLLASDALLASLDPRVATAGDRVTARSSP